MKLHTVVVSYNRLELTKQVIQSYFETITVPYSLYVVDNGSDDETTDWLIRGEALGYFTLMLLGSNRYPGFATNRGWEMRPDDATHLHRQDNDFLFLPGWCEQLAEAFGDPVVGQVGLRTDEEELHCATNVGGCNVIRRELWDGGLRWDERPWDVLGSVTEDYWLTQAIVKRGWRWTRVKRPAILALATGHLNDPYYLESYGVRGIIDAERIRQEQQSDG